MNRQEIFSILQVMQSASSNTEELKYALFNHLLQLSQDVKVKPNKTYPVHKKDRQYAKKGKGVINFSKEEIEAMPKSFKHYFIYNNEVVYYRFHRGMFHARYHKNGMNIEVASVSYDIMKQKFIRKVAESVPPEEVSQTVFAQNIMQPPTIYKKVLFGDYGEEWLKIKEKVTKTSTFKEYSRLFHTNLKPQFGGMYLDEITRSKVQEYLFSFVEQGKHRTADKLKLHLTCIFDMAEDDYGIPSPMKKIVLPFYEAKKGSAFTKEEEKRLVEYCRNHPDKESSSALLCLLYFGIRQSELASMKVIDNRWLEVETSKERMGRNVVIRKIPFTPMVKENLPYIDFRKASQTNQRTIASTMNRQFPNHHPHELRYTYITRCKECGVNPEIVMLWDGHEADKDVKSSRVDRGYTDFSQEFQLKEAEKVKYEL